MYKILTLLADNTDPVTGGGAGGAGGAGGTLKAPGGGIGTGAKIGTGGEHGVVQNIGVTEIVQNVINWILYAIGIVSVVMIIVGGIRYAASAGNEKAVTGAKNTIIYALIGLAAAVLAWVLVNFVLGALGSPGADATGV